MNFLNKSVYTYIQTNKIHEIRLTATSCLNLFHNHHRAGGKYRREVGRIIVQTAQEIQEKCEIEKDRGREREKER